MSETGVLRMLPYLLVKMNNTAVQIPGLPPEVVPIFLIKSTYSMGRGDKRKKASLKLFPVTLSYTITDYKCQGETYRNGVLLDLKKPKIGQSSAVSSYVQLSRAQALRNIYIMRDFDGAELNTSLPKELTAELA
jgi:hypothetical protein